MFSVHPLSYVLAARLRIHPFKYRLKDDAPLLRVYSKGGERRISRNGVKSCTMFLGPGLCRIDEEEHEAAVGRLLRLSLTRFAVVSEVDHA